MAAHLVRAGHEVIGFNRSQAAVEALVEAGGRRGESLADVSKGSDVVITMLPDSPDVEEVVLGEDGILNNVSPGTTIIDMSTVQPRTAIAVAEAAAARDVESLDAPVSGGQVGAEEASLSIMVGGEAATFEKAKPLFEAVGKTIVHVGPAGAGQTVKAANQLVVAGTIELIAEAIVLLEASGVDAEAGLKVLAGGLAGSRLLELKAENMLARSFTPGFRVDLHHKDMGIVLDAARSTGAAVPLGTLVGQLMASVRARGDGALDHTALLRLVDAMSGRSDG
jgi:2-hydroxy-3-oxopropionate reductase